MCYQTYTTLRHSTSPASVLQSESQVRAGEMAEWLKAHAWKACIPQGIQGSNPCLSAITFAKPPRINERAQSQPVAMDTTLKSAILMCHRF